MPVHFLDRVHRPANGAIAVGIVLEVRLEDWFQHELGGGLNHPIANRRNAERSLASAVWLRDHHPPHRVGPVLLRDEFLAQARQPRLQAPLLDLGKTHPVHTWSARIRASQPVGMAKDVFTTNLVVEHVEAKGGLRLRLAIELSLKGPDLLRCYQAHHQSPSPHHLQKRTRSQGPFLHRHYPASTVVLPVRPPPWPPPDATLRPLPSPPTGLPRLPEPPFRRAVPTTPADRVGARVDCFPTRAAFPKWPEGRHPHCHFRGLLSLYSRYGPSDCSAAQGGLGREAPALPVTRPSRSSATRSIDNSLGGTLLHW